MSDFETRRKKLRSLTKKAGIGALLVTDFTNVTYLTGFTGDSSYLLLMPQGEVILSDSRYTVQLAEECPGLDVESRTSATPMLKLIEKVVRRGKLARLGFEAASMTVAEHSAIANVFAKTELVATVGLVEQLRMIKDRDEISELRIAVKFAERAFAVIRNAIRPDQTEREIAFNLEHQIRQFGGDACAFKPIVACGPRAALPHAIPTDRRVEESGFLLIDWGALSPKGYRSDLTRVLVTGKISPKLERIYRVVLKAQQRAIAKIRPGVPASDVDAAARNVIAKAGFGKYFGHGLGHGVGLDIHEEPRLSKSNSQPLKPGMVITIEPGIYLPGFGGVRIEDDMLVTRDGHEVLTSVPKRWDEAVAVA
ncbi:MAG: Xaa-Pro peptidase family protein [Pirellulales bacterium]